MEAKHGVEPEEIDDISSPKEKQPIEINSKEKHPEEINPEEIRPEEINPKEINSEEINPKEINSEEINPDDKHPEEINPDEKHPVEINLEEIRPEEKHPVEINPEEINPEEINPEEINPEEITPDDINLSEKDNKTCIEKTIKEPIVDIDNLELKVDEEINKILEVSDQQLDFKSMKEFINSESDNKVKTNIITKYKQRLLNKSHKENNRHEKVGVKRPRNIVNNDIKNEDNNTRLKVFLVKNKDNFYLTLTFQLIIIYLEVVFHLLKFESINKYSILYVLSAIPAGGLLTVLTGLFNNITNKIITWVLVIGLSLIYCAQLVYHYVFKAFLSLYSVGAIGTDVLEFYDQIVMAIIYNIPGLLLLIMPLPVLGLLMKKVLILKKKNIKMQGSLLAGSIITHIMFIAILPAYGKEAYSPYDLYHNTWIQEMSIQQLGVLTSTRFDIEQLIFNKNHNSLEVGLILEPTPIVVEIPQIPKVADVGVIKSNKIVTPTPLPTAIPIDTSPNILDIDFKALEELEPNTDIKTMHQYFAATAPTNKNKYTGMFEGYNLILITAEGFSPYAVNEKVTPTLYKLTHEGFIFNNFYTPLWWASTSDGEYVATTSLIPKSGVISYYESGSNAMPFAFGTQFSKLGYSTRAYHNHTYTYYKRHISHPNMGYIYKGVGNGLEIKNSWPESDLEMMEVTIPEYIDDQPFHTYYMTVSGHMNYTFIGNSMSTKNKAVVEDLPYSLEAKAYIACNVELDKALEKLLKDLEEKGIAEKTVIALSADHYPYGLEKDKIDELVGHEVEENFELYRNHFILWSGSIKEPIIIDKASSSLDIIPTLSNLFGLPYDSRLLMGQDILSDAAPLVMFSNRSFINDKVMYNSVTKEVTKLTEEELPDDYIKTMNQIVNNKFLISKSILEKDYYNYIIPKDKAEYDQSDED